MAKFELSPAAQASRRARGGGCLNGTCGPYASLCYQCDKEETAEHRAWASGITTPPMPGEDYGAYWQRVGGRFIDSWYTVASETYRRLTAITVNCGYGAHDENSPDGGD